MTTVATNILITGTPGTGKTSTAELLGELSGLNVVNVSQLVKTRELHTGKDEEWDSYLLDENKVLDELEELLSKGGNIIDFHSCDFFPERWFQLVIVLRTDNEVLYPRLQARNYSEKKIGENIEAEIMCVCRDEALASYDSSIVHEMSSNNLEDMERNVQMCMEWLAKRQGSQ